MVYIHYFHWPSQLPFHVQRLVKNFNMHTLPKTNIAPENGCLEYYLPIGEAYFQVQFVSFREGNPGPLGRTCVVAKLAMIGKIVISAGGTSTVMRHSKKTTGR